MTSAASPAEYCSGMARTKVLFISSSLGLGHAIRDLAIADELHRAVPGLGLTWLAAGAARTAIEDAGGALHPRADEFAGLDDAAEAAAFGHSLRLDDYGVRAADAWNQRHALFRKIMAAEQWDLVIGDETYEIWFPLHDEPPPPCPFVMIYDFVGLGRIGWPERLSRDRTSFSYRQATDHHLLRSFKSQGPLRWRVGRHIDRALRASPASEAALRRAALYHRWECPSVRPETSP